MRRSFQLQLLLELFTVTHASKGTSQRPATSFQVHFNNSVFFSSFLKMWFSVSIWWAENVSGNLFWIRCICIGRMQRWEIETKFSKGSQNQRAWRIQSSPAYLSQRTCQEHRGMFSEIDQQQRAILRCGLNCNLIFTPSEVKKARNSHILSWFFHLQASETTNSV